MRVLLIGGGGREHALAGALAASPRLSKLFAAPGNAGIENVAECIPLDSSDNRAVVDFCRKEAIDLVVVGPEGPLVAGLVDRLKEAKIRAFGPSAAAAQLEGSKVFTKVLCAEENIPTAGYEAFSDRKSALAYVEKHAMPVVVKADGLAAGKGVTIAMTLDDARKAVEGIFLEDGAQVVIEEHLVGEEASFFVLCDGKTARPLTTAQDFKRAYDGDEGPNTGGMGAYSPAPVMDVGTQARTMREIIEPTLAAMAKRGMPFCGILYAGLMITADGPKLIEYNVRFGDPECQVLMMRLESDLLALLDAAVAGTLDRTSIAWRKEHALTVVMAAKGYPGPYEKGSTIKGLEEAAAVEGATVFHAGTRRVDGDILAAGGRVLNVGAIGADLTQARKRAYEAVGRIDWPEGFCRSDIGEAASRRG